MSNATPDPQVDELIERALPEFHRRLVTEAAELLVNFGNAIRPAAAAPENQIWKFSNSPAGVAVISVLIGGAFAAGINGCIQSHMQERQLQHEIVTAYSAFQLDVQKSYLDSQSRIGREATELVGAMTARTQDYLMTHFSQDYALSNPRASEKLTPGEKKRNEKIREQKNNALDAFNSFQIQWRTKTRSVGTMLTYYYYNDKNVSQAWQEVVGAVDVYVSDVSNLKQPKKEWKGKPPVEEMEKPIREKLEKLRLAMLKAREEGSKRSPDVDRIKELLKQSRKLSDR